MATPPAPYDLPGYTKFTLPSESELRLSLESDTTKKSSSSTEANNNHLSNESDNASSSANAGENASLNHTQFYIHNSRVSVTLLSGTADILGLPLPLLTPVPLAPGPTSLAIFTFLGCVLIVHPTSPPSSTLGAPGKSALEAIQEFNTDSEDFDMILTPYVEIAYVSKNDAAVERIALLNTHSQIEIGRDKTRAGILSIINNFKNGGYSDVNGMQSIVNTLPLLAPRILIIGPSSSGKTSCVKTLLSYALKCNRCPSVINLDPSKCIEGIGGGGMGGVSVTGFNFSNVVGDNQRSDVGMPYFNTPGNATHSFQTCYTNNSLVYFTGGNKITDNVGLYDKLISKIGATYDKRVESVVSKYIIPSINNSTSSSSGGGSSSSSSVEGIIPSQVLNEISSGFIAIGPNVLDDGEHGISSSIHAIEVLKINLVVVIGSEKGYALLKSKINGINADDGVKGRVIGGGFEGPWGKGANAGKNAIDIVVESNIKNNPIKLLKLPKSTGCIQKQNDTITKHRTAHVRSYFYNTSSLLNSATSLTPRRITKDIRLVRIFKLSSVSLSLSLLPVGQKTVLAPVHLSRSVPTQNMQHSLLAVCHPNAVANFEAAAASDNDDPGKYLYEASVCGYVLVVGVDVGREKITILSPFMGDLPSLVFLEGGEELNHMDS